MLDKNIKIGLLLGGASGEREVSQMSSKGVYNSLLELGFDCKLIDPALGIEQPKTVEDFFSNDNKHIIKSTNYLQTFNSDLFDGLDIVFNGLHGTWGEDGTVQSLLEMKNIKYTGSGVLASSIAMNKTFTKVMFQHYDVRTPKWILFTDDIGDLDKLKMRIKDELKFPCVVKPNNQGSALGLTICDDESNLKDALISARKYSHEVLIEEYISGYELTVGVMDDVAFPPLEIKPKHNFYDYICKYTKGMSEYEVPAKFPEHVLDELKRQALYAFKSIDGKSYGRIDFRLNENHETYCLEVNTLPGLTSTSLLPKTAAAHGISFNDLILKIIEDSLRIVR